MARKKRKYIRRKPLRHDTVPMSSIVVGLLPLLFMAGIVGMYILYQYGDLVMFPDASQFSPDITLPEITISFTDVGHAIGNSCLLVLEFLVSVSESIVRFVTATFSHGSVASGSLSSNLFQSLGAGYTAVVDSVTAVHKSVVEYIQVVGWTIGDFFQYLDIPGKIQSMLDIIFWPIQFLNPMPAVNATNQKIGETNQTIAHALSPIWPIFSYIWEEFKKTASELWQNIIEAFKFITWLIKK